MNQPSSQIRYSRQIALPEIGEAGQRRIAAARVLCVGAGGLGSPALLYLCAAGVGAIGVIDSDQVDVSNLQRQILYRTEDAGHPKATMAAAHLQALNPEVRIEAIHESLHAGNALRHFSGYDIIIDGTDNFAAKLLINDAAVKTGKPVVYGSISKFEGRLSVFWAKHGPCYRCLHPAPPRATVQNCAEAGVIGAVAGVIGTLQALEAMKLALLPESAGALGDPALKPLIGELLVVDCTDLGFARFRVDRNPACPTCSKPADEIELSDLEISCRIKTARITEVAPDEIEPLLARGNIALIDVREPEEFAAGRIPGALNLPLSELEELPRERVPTGRELLVYCRSGHRSRTAMDLLQAKGFSEFFHLTYGILSWPGPVERA